MNLKLFQNMFTEKTKCTLKIQSGVIRSYLDSRSPICTMRLDGPRCSDAGDTRISTQSAPGSLWASGWVLSAWFTTHRTWTRGIWVESQLYKVSCFPFWLRLNEITYVKEFYKLSNTNINCYCWITYKCNLGISQMCEIVCNAWPHHASHWSAPGSEKALMGRPISHASTTTSPKQGQAVRESVCYGCIRKGGKKSPLTPSLHTPLKT